MPQLRQDPISGRWVIIAENRADRPQEYSAAPRQLMEPCPFCAGYEDQTPGAVAVYPAAAAAEGAWLVRVIPNKYPAVQQEEDAATDLPFSARSAIGVHEVFIESRRHVTSFAELSAEEARWTFVAYRDRLMALREDSRIQYALVFKNAREAGGASLEHVHSQLLATSFIPPDIQWELARAGEHRSMYGTCLFCELLAEDLESDRMVAATENFVAICPYASRFPFEMCVLPRDHAEAFEETSDEELSELSSLVQKLIQRLEQCWDSPAYNFWIHSVPLERSQHDDYHWHIEIAPRITQQAGFEFGTGCFINPVAPEDAARRLRSVSL